MSAPLSARLEAMRRMARGRAEVSAGRLAAAIRWFDGALAVDPQCAQAVLYRAGLRLAAGDVAGATDDFALMERLDHRWLPAYRDLNTLSAEEHPGLLEASARAVAAAPRRPWAHVFRAFSLRSLMRYEDAVRCLERAVALAPRSAALRAMLSRVKLTNRQDAYDGVGDMEAAVRLAPGWGWLRCWLGEARRHQGQFARALADLDAGLRLDPAYRRGYAWRGGVLNALGRRAEAAADLTRALEWDPVYSFDFEYTADQKSWAYNQRALAWRALGDWRRALWDMDRAHRFGPRYLWVFDPKKRPESLEAGLRELDTALRALPGSASARAWKGRTLLQAGRPEEAARALRPALARSPRHVLARAWLAEAELALGELRAAEREASRALSLDPAYAPAWGCRARARRALGRTAAAERDFTSAIRADHRASWAFAGRGECRRAQGDLAGSLRDLDRALAIHPDYPEALAWRAETRRLQGDLDGALADADAALAARPVVWAYLTRSLVRQARKDYAGQIQDFHEAARLDPRFRAHLGAA